MATFQKNRFKVSLFHRVMAFAERLASLPNRLTPPPFRLIQIGSAFWQSRALYTAASLGLADHLASGERGCAELAAALSLDEDKLYRLMRMLASLGVFRESAPRHFANSPLSECLRSDHAQSVRDIILLHNSPAMTHPWMESLEPAMRSGAVPFVLSHGAELFDYLDQHPAFDEQFSRAMDAVEGLTGTAYLDDFDWGCFERVIDVGGSQGSKALTILKRHPALQAIVFDRPGVIAGAAEHWRQKGEEVMLERMHFVGGDMFEAIPAATGEGDVYLFIAVFHGLDDDCAVRVLQNLRKAMGESGAVAVIADTVVAERGIDAMTAGFDMQMLISSRGRERTEAQWRTLMAKAGFAVAELVRVRTFVRFIVIRPEP